MVRKEAASSVRIGYVQNQRIMTRPAFGDKNLFHGEGVVATSGQAINGFGGKADQMSVQQRIGGAGDGGLGGPMDLGMQSRGR